MTFEYIKQNTDKYVMNTYSRYPVCIVSGKGSTVYDEKGRSYIDFTSGIGVCGLGYGDDEWVKAVSKQAMSLAHISNLFYTVPQVELAKGLTEFSGMSRVFFSNSGAEANEGAIKLARKYSHDKYGEGRSTIVALDNSFHGRTVTTLAATGQDAFQQHFFPFTPGFKFAKANDIESLKEAVDGSVCAIMVEAIQGEGGVMPLEPAFVTEIYKIAKERDILVIFDEVQTGMGRTGEPFGFNHFEGHPDIVTLAKCLGGGLPIGAFMCNDKLRDVLGYSHHGSTYGANPICCAGAQVVLNRLSSDGFLRDVREKGEYIREKIKAESIKCVKDVRGMGLMTGIEVDGRDHKKMVSEMIEGGLLVLTAGKNVIRLLPPLTITYEEIDAGLKILLNKLKEEATA